MRNLLTDIAGVSVGHVTDLALGSGVTAVLFDRPAIASASVLGGAPGGRDTTLMEPEMTVERVDGIALSGGSAFGLDAAGGLQAWFRDIGRGTLIGTALIPIVPQAIIFDLLNGGNKEWGRFSPYREMGWAAAEAASSGDFALGTVGAGTGATTATVKGGLGSASMVTPEGYRVAALVVVNAVGNPLIGDGPHFWSAPFELNGEFGDRGYPPFPLSPDAYAPRLKGQRSATPETGTTIGVVVTDAPLTKPQAKRLAIAAQDGLARAVLAVHLPFDGDTMFAASTGEGPAVGADILSQLCHEATIVTARAIARGVYEAAALPYPDAQADWKARFT
ncbi:P1 family peptidase [Acidisoma cladoniae]|jgi:L-aminopeptidase/D-esterase-like protein|uniref:P1 family peptidase n=1 Tax=Acidisoma cladoniae TaxID=3040935 RepID=UPI00254A5FD5|nr:P1 family peptidase [Acidisoma sp. PAMC 29798]